MRYNSLRIEQLRSIISTTGNLVRQSRTKIVNQLEQIKYRKKTQWIAISIGIVILLIMLAVGGILFYLYSKKTGWSFLQELRGKKELMSFIGKKPAPSTRPRNETDQTDDGPAKNCASKCVEQNFICDFSGVEQILLPPPRPI